MNRAIELAVRSAPTHLRVAAVVATTTGEFVAEAVDRQPAGESWSSLLLRESATWGESEPCNLFLTINSLGNDREFEFTRFLAVVGIAKLFVGLPDPSLTAYRSRDPVTTLERVSRFPDELQRAILRQNAPHYTASPQSIQCNLHYSTCRISQGVKSGLEKCGPRVNCGRDKRQQETYFAGQCDRRQVCVDYWESYRLVLDVLAQAFDAKYGDYEDEADARSAHLDWAGDFSSVYRSATELPLRERIIVNVGVGAGNEAPHIFKGCNAMTFVDIAESGLEKVVRAFPRAKTIAANAEDLSRLPSNSAEVYVSLCTFNSSFFDMGEAAAEAHRVLRPGGVAVVSIANGFLDTASGQAVVPGLIVPGTDFVNLYRDTGAARELLCHLSRAGFVRTYISPASTEIFVTGQVT